MHRQLILSKVKETVNINFFGNRITKKNGAPPKDYKNISKVSGKVLPKNTTYKEYDVISNAKGQNRGTEKIVIGADGSVFYRNDHFKIFIKVR